MKRINLKQSHIDAIQKVVEWQKYTKRYLTPNDEWKHVCVYCGHVYDGTEPIHYKDCEVPVLIDLATLLRGMYETT